MSSDHNANRTASPLPTLQVEQSWLELLQPPARAALESQALAAYLPGRRWFSGQGQQVTEPRLLYATALSEADEGLQLGEVVVSRADGSQEHYQVPLGFLADPQTASALARQLALAHVRVGQQTGLLTDGFALSAFVRQVLVNLQQSVVLNGQGGDIQFVPTANLHTLGDLGGTDDVQLISAEQSNSSAIIDRQAVLKLVRRVLPGIHPESEVGGYLTAAGFTHIPPLLGEVRRVDAQGMPHTLMILQGYVSNQGDAWQWTLGRLERAVGNEQGALAELQSFAARLGQRLGEMHVALGQASDNPDFGFRPTGDAEAADGARNVAAQIRQALSALDERRGDLSAEHARHADELMARRDAILQQVDELARSSAGGIRMRVHGDLHLGQVLVADGDAWLIDFEGEPTRSLDERRGFYSPYKDVAGMLRSFDYAAAMLVRSANDADDSASARQRVAEQYRSQARTAFIDAYGQAAAALPHAWHERDGEAAALALFGIEKAAYEILYEAHYRPAWLDVPVQGLLELTTHLLGSGKR